MNNSLNGLIFDCQRLALYHSIRQHWLEQCHRWALFVVIVFGTGSVGSILAGAPTEVAAALGCVPATMGALDLVFAFSDRAHHHNSLYRGFCELLGDIESEAPSDDLTRTWTKRLHMLFASEPPPYRALEAWCHNAVCAMRNSPENQRLRIPYAHILLRNIFSFTGAEYRLRA